MKNHIKRCFCIFFLVNKVLLKDSFTIAYMLLKAAFVLQQLS